MPLGGNSILHARQSDVQKSGPPETTFLWLQTAVVEMEQCFWWGFLCDFGRLWWEFPLGPFETRYRKGVPVKMGRATCRHKKAKRIRWCMERCVSVCGFASRVPARVFGRTWTLPLRTSERPRRNGRSLAYHGVRVGCKRRFFMQQKSSEVFAQKVPTSTEHRPVTRDPESFSFYCFIPPPQVGSAHALIPSIVMVGRGHVVGLSIYCIVDVTTSQYAPEIFYQLTTGSSLHTYVVDGQHVVHVNGEVQVWNSVSNEN